MIVRNVTPKPEPRARREIPYVDLPRWAWRPPVRRPVIDADDGKESRQVVTLLVDSVLEMDEA